MSSPTSPAVALRGITKAFPGVLANDAVDFAIHAGEVHALLGENGAGKSTLMSILSGMAEPDAGEILVDGAPVRMDAPRRALELGIGTVYQHLTLVPNLTVLENLLLGSKGLRLDMRAARARFAELIGVLGADIDPDREAGTLALGQQQQVEIVKALWRGSRVLVLDEPTSMLTPQGVAELQGELGRLKAAGLGIVFITHKLHEAIEIGDRVTVLKGGRVVEQIDPDALHGLAPEQLKRRIVAAMFGEGADELAGVAEMEAYPGEQQAAARAGGEPLLELVDVEVATGPGEMPLQGVSLTVHRGEILGVAGVDGNGQRELAEAIAGQRPLTAGDVSWEGRSIRRQDVRARQMLGLRYITDDRLHEGIVSELTVAQNMVLKRIGEEPFWRRGRIDQAAIDAFAAEQVERFQTRTPSVSTRIGALSGGNIQKVLLARELSFSPRLVVFNKPTHGLDVKTASFVRDQIRVQAGEGVTSVVISTELDELVALCDRIAVLSRGRLTGVVENGAGAYARIGELMVA